MWMMEIQSFSSQCVRGRLRISCRKNVREGLRFKVRQSRFHGSQVLWIWSSILWRTSPERDWYCIELPTTHYRIVSCCISNSLSLFFSSFIKTIHFEFLPLFILIRSSLSTYSSHFIHSFSCSPYLLLSQSILFHSLSISFPLLHQIQTQFTSFYFYWWSHCLSCYCSGSSHTCWRNSLFHHHSFITPSSLAGISSILSFSTRRRSSSPWSRHS